MRDKRFLRIVFAFTLVGAAVGLVPACGGGGGGGGGGDVPDMYLQSFLIVDKFGNQIGGPNTTEIFRDARLLFTFNTAVDFASVSNRTIRIGQPTPGGLIIEASGRFDAVLNDPNQIVFIPTSTDVAKGENNPFGFEANAQYDVHIPTVLETGFDVFVKNGKGDGIVQGLATSFTTGNDYSQDFQQPEFIGSTPADGATDVDATADVDMNFDRPMRPDSFSLGDTINVTNLDTGRRIVGTVRTSPDAKTISFRPLIGYGPGKPDPLNPGQFVGHDILVTVSRSVVSFSGNPLAKDIRIQFQTVYDPDQPIVDELDEDFETKTFEEVDPLVFNPTNPVAAWDEPATSGLLAGLVGTGTITVKRSTGNFLFPPWAWGLGGTNLKFHAMLTAAEMGSQSRTITGYDWFYNASQSANNATNVTINLGHTDLANLTGTFANNFTVGGTIQPPTTVVNNIASYPIPLGGPRWLAGPTFTKNHTYKGGTLNYILEIICTPGPGGPNGNPRVTFAGAWGVLTTAPQSRTVYTFPGSATGTVVRYYVDLRYHWLITQSEAQSKFYDFGASDPSYLDMLALPDITEQPAGTSSVFEFEGAKEDINSPGNPDLNSTSGWQSSLVNVSGFRFVRFRVLMGANITSNQAPAYDKLTFPFVFFD